MSEPPGFNYEIRNDSSESGEDENNFKDSVKNLLSSSFHFLKCLLITLHVKQFNRNKVNYLK